MAAGQTADEAALLGQALGASIARAAFSAKAFAALAEEILKHVAILPPDAIEKCTAIVQAHNTVVSKVDPTILQYLHLLQQLRLNYMATRTGRDPGLKQ